MKTRQKSFLENAESKALFKPPHLLLFLSLPSLIFNQIILQQNLTVVSTNEKAKLQVEICVKKHRALPDGATVIKNPKKTQTKKNT